MKKVLMKKILIIGAGYVGGKLAENLKSSGYDVTVTTRSGKSSIEKTLPLSLEDQNSMNNLPIDFDGVVYSVSPSDTSYQLVYVEGLSRIINTFKHVKKFLLTSSTSVYTETNGGWVYESSPVNYEDPKTKAILTGEKMVIDTFGGTAIRFSGIYGPGRMRYIEYLKNQIPLHPDSMEIWTNRIHQDTCAKVLQTLLETEEIPPVINATEPNPQKLGDILNALSEKHNLPKPNIHPDGQRLMRGGNKRVRGSIIFFPFLNC